MGTILRSSGGGSVYTVDLRSGRRSTFTAASFAAARSIVVQSFVDPTSSAAIITVNLAQNCLGTGVLSLADAVQLASIIPFVVAMLIANLTHCVMFFLLAEMSEKTCSASYRELWQKTVGKRTVSIIDALVVANCFSNCFTFAMLIGDFSSRSFQGLFPTATFAHNPDLNILLLAAFVLFPVCLLRDLSRLKFTSTLGLLCTCYLAVFLVIDCWSNWGAERVDRGGFLSKDVVEQGLLVWDTQIFRALPLVFLPQCTEYNGPKFYSELRRRSKWRFVGACAAAFLVTDVLYFSAGLAGYARFGPSSPAGVRLPGSILSNYGSDGLNYGALLCWLGMSFVLMGNFALQFNAARDGALGIMRSCGIDPLAEKDGPFAVITAFGIVLAVAISFLHMNPTSINMARGIFVAPALSFAFPSMMFFGLEWGRSRWGWRHLFCVFFLALAAVLAAVPLMAVLTPRQRS